MDAVMKYINRIHRCFRKWQSDKMDSHGINGVQQNYLFHIYKKPGISQEDLCEHILVNKSNVARQLSVLEQEGWIIRKPSSHDKRVYEVYLTEKAEKIMPDILALMKNWNQMILEDLTQEEQLFLLNLLPKITQKAKELERKERDKS